MKISEEDLKAVFREFPSEDRSACLSADDLRLTVSSSLPNNKRAAVAEHLATCSDCVAEYRELRSLEHWAKQDAEQSGVKVVPAVPWSARFVWLLSPRYAIAAVILVLIFAAIPFLVRQDQPTDPLRGGNFVELNSVPSDRAELKEVPQRLSWSSSNPSYGYRVALYDFESSQIWESGLVKENSIELPSDVRSKLKPGQVYYWRVVFLNGSPRQSKLLQFKLSENAQ